MKYFLSITLLITLLLSVSCGSKNEDHSNDPDVILYSKDSLTIANLVQDMYEWHENTEHQADFEPKTKNEADSAYTSLDWTTTDKQIRAIRSSGYFDVEFVNSYKRIAHYIDDELKSGRTTWYVGEMSPLETGANRWCNCQDVPNESFWNDITLSNLKITGNEATFSWTWGSDFQYKAAARKTDEKWRISYLEGFDLKNYQL